jgi:hypothetical protein
MVGGLWLHRHRIPHIDGGGVVHSRELTASTVTLVTIARWSFAHFVRFFAFAHLASTALRATSRFDGARAGHGDSTAALFRMITWFEDLAPMPEYAPDAAVTVQ